MGRLYDIKLIQGDFMAKLCGLIKRLENFNHVKSLLGSEVGLCLAVYNIDKVTDVTLVVWHTVVIIKIRMNTGVNTALLGIYLKLSVDA